MNTIVEFGEFKNNKTLSIWEVDAEGNKTKQVPVLAFGLKKAKVLIEHMNKIEEFVAKNDTSNG